MGAHEAFGIGNPSMISSIGCGVPQDDLYLICRLGLLAGV